MTENSAPSKSVDAFYNERNDTVTLQLNGTLHTMYASHAWELIGILQSELALAGQVLDQKGD